MGMRWYRMFGAEAVSHGRPLTLRHAAAIPLVLLKAERERWALWSPVFLGAGITVYFALPSEPPIEAGFMFLSICAIALIWAWWRRADAWSALFALPTAAAIGLIIAGWATARAEAPVLAGERVWSGVSGRVVAVEPFADGARVRLENLSMPGWWRNDAPPEAIRVKLRRDDPAPVIGQRIQVTARMSPPPRPSFPGAYDFARSAWFDRLGGVGFAFSHWRLVPSDASISPADRVVATIERFRADLSTRLRIARPDVSGHVLAALLTGDRSGVPEPVLEDLRRSGLAHLLAISGLHIGMVAAIVFVTMRMCLALNESWARDRPIKKWAAAAALIASFAYLILSGATIPTQRAFLMTGIVLIAVLTDRLAISMRLVAVAAGAVLILAPESVVGPSFQLSFAAVIALVAVYEQYRLWAGRIDADGPHRKTVRYLAAVCLTTVIAGVATAPFAIYHFGQVAHYSVLANLVAVPIVTFMVMPLGLLSLALMPIGLEAIPAMGAGWGIDAVLWIAEQVADLPGSVAQIPAMPEWGLALVAVGGLWCAIWQRAWRFCGLPVLIAGILSPYWMAAPIAILHEDGEQAAIVWRDGLWLESSRKERFAQNVWSEKTAFPVLGDWKDLAKTPDAPIRCDPLGCALALRLTNGETVTLSFVSDPRALREDCALSTLVRAPVVPHPSLCVGVQVVNPADLKRNGTYAVYASRDELRLETVEERRGERPWTRAR
jgi:competence protein ComEC